MVSKRPNSHRLDLLYSTWNSAQGYVAAWVGGEFGGEWMHVYVWLSPLAVRLKLPQHRLLISYTPVYYGVSTSPAPDAVAVTARSPVDPLLWLSSPGRAPNAAGFLRAVCHRLPRKRFVSFTVSL